jgi:hypothetical protein
MAVAIAVLAALGAASTSHAASGAVHRGRLPAPIALVATSTGVLPGPARAIALADFDGDGRLDAVVASGSSFDVLRGDGRGHLTHETTLTDGGAQPQVWAADVTGDGRADVLAATSTGISVFVSLGARGFRLASRIAAPIDVPGSIALGDMNNDGRLDVVIASLRDSVLPDDDVSRGPYIVALNNGDGTFTTSIAIVHRQAGLFTLADVDGDGVLDIVGFSSWENEDSIDLYRGLGGGRFDDSATIRSTVSFYQAEELCAGDVNDDGRNDLVIDNSGPVAVEPLGNGTLAAHRIARQVTTGGCVVADLSGDGRNDFISWDESLLVRIDSGGRFVPTQYVLPAGGGYVIAAAGDLNGDGRADLVTVRGDRIETWPSTRGEPTLNVFAVPSRDGSAWIVTARASVEGILERAVRSGTHVRYRPYRRLGEAVWVPGRQSFSFGPLPPGRYRERLVLTGVRGARVERTRTFTL